MLCMLYVLSFLFAIGCGWFKRHKWFGRKKTRGVTWLINPTVATAVLWLGLNTWISKGWCSMVVASSLWPPCRAWVMVILVLVWGDKWGFSICGSCTKGRPPPIYALLVVLRKEEETSQLLEAKQCGHPAWWMSQLSLCPPLIQSWIHLSSLAL